MAIIAGDDAVAHVRHDGAGSCGPMASSGPGTNDELIEVARRLIASVAVHAEPVGRQLKNRGKGAASRIERGRGVLSRGTLVGVTVVAGTGIRLARHLPTFSFRVPECPERGAAL